MASWTFRRSFVNVLAGVDESVARMVLDLSDLTFRFVIVTFIPGAPRPRPASAHQPPKGASSSDQNYHQHDQRRDGVEHADKLAERPQPNRLDAPSGWYCC